MALTQEDYQLMEDFIKGRLKGASMQAFFDRLKTDAEFNRQYHQHREQFFAERFNKPNIRTTEEVDREENAPAPEEIVPTAPQAPEPGEKKPRKVKQPRQASGKALQGGIVWLVIGVSMICVGLSLFLLLDRVIFAGQVKQIASDRDSSRIRKIREILADTPAATPSGSTNPHQEPAVSNYKVAVDTLEVEDAALLRDTLFEPEGDGEPLKVEFWKDPIRPKGYIYSGEVLQLYGLDESQVLNLHWQGDSLLLDMNEKTYWLRSGSRYQQFRPLQRKKN